MIGLYIDRLSLVLDQKKEIGLLFNKSGCARLQYLAL